MSTPFRLRRLVAFAETDMAGIMHFSSFFLFMESAEHALLRSIGLSVFDSIDDGEGEPTMVSFPRVSARCDYHSPARCEEELDIEVSVQRLGTKSITYGFHFTRDGKELAVGQMTSVCCRMHDDKPPEPIALPEEVISACVSSWSESYGRSYCYRSDEKLPDAQRTAGGAGRCFARDVTR